MAARKSVDKGISQRSDGRWVYRWTAGVREDGKPNRRSKYFASRAEARAFAKKRAEMSEQERSFSPSRAILRDWVRTCLKVYGSTLSGETVRGYTSVLESRISPSELGGLALADIRPYNVQTFINDLAQELSPKSVRNVYGVVRWALSRAMQNNLIAENPTVGCALPQRKKPVRRVLTPEMAGDILRAAKDHRDYALWIFVAATGARLSEALGLPWAAVDLATGRYEIRQTVTLGADMEPRINDRTKTENAVRTGVLPETVCRELRRHRAAQGEQRMSVGELWRDNGLVFPDPFGLPQHRNAVLSRLRRLQLACGIPEDKVVGSHAFRHLIATQLLKSGVSDAAVASQLGHYSAAYTRAQYMDSYDSEQLEVAAVAAKIVGL